jgi:signal transduction histidine kinase
MTFINPAAAKMLELDEKKALGQPLERLLEHRRADGSAFPDGASPIVASLKDGQARRGTNEVFQRGGGSSLPADYYVTPTIERSELIGVVVTFSDVTERNRTDREIQHHLQRIRALHEIDIAITSSLDLRNILDVLLEKIDLFFDYASASTLRLFDPSTGALEPMACHNLDPNEWRTEEWKSGERLSRIVFESQAPLMIPNVQSDPRISNTQIFKNQGIFSYLGIPLIAKGKPLGVLGLYAKKQHRFSRQEIDFMMTLAGQAAIAIYNSQLHEETKKQADALEKSNKIKDDFLSVTSHELRTPLITIMGYARLLEDQSLGELLPEQLKAARVIKNRADDLLAMIRSILDATKLEAAAMTVEQEVLDVKGFLDDLVKLYDVPLQKAVVVRWDYDGNLPTILTDGVKLKSILQNLISNSLKFTERGQVTVSARPLPQKRSVEFTVADTGIGISAGLMPVIFEKFRQADGSEARHHEGIGLGLYLVKKFTELLEGSIECQSAVGRGSVFTLVIPDRS